MQAASILSFWDDFAGATTLVSLPLAFAFWVIGGKTVMSQDNTEAKALIADLVARSRAAQKQIEHYSQEQVDALIRAMVWSVAKPGIAEEIAQFTVDETQLGNYDGKFLKIQRKTRATLLDIIHDRSVGIIEEYPDRNIRVLAKPLGVIGALAPSTNPEATPVIKGIHAVKGRNSIIVAPHPRAKLTNKKICDLMRAALKKMGAPEDLVIGIETPSLESTNELMRQCDLVLATGGGAMVNAAYSSGTPALGVGVGNAVITVDDTADLDAAAEKSTSRRHWTSRRPALQTTQCCCSMAFTSPCWKN